MIHANSLINPVIRIAFGCIKTLSAILNAHVFVGRSIRNVPEGSIVFFPCHYSLFFCGLAGIVTVVKKSSAPTSIDIQTLEKSSQRIFSYPFSLIPKDRENIWKNTEIALQVLFNSVRELKQDDMFIKIARDSDFRLRLSKIAASCLEFCSSEEKWLIQNMGIIPSETVDFISRFLETLKDIAWSITFELLENIKKIEELILEKEKPYPPHSIINLKRINSVLNSIDRLEVRGRDSAGLSIMMTLDESEYERFQKELDQKNLKSEFISRLDQEVLSNLSISINRSRNKDGNPRATIALTYKVAAEIGNLGDNIRFLRNQIRKDGIFWTLIEASACHVTVLCHTRWASVGAITLANCHPVDNRSIETSTNHRSIIHVCLNGDIDNYLELKRNLEKNHIHIHPDITSDTKIIPLQIEVYLRKGFDIGEAFRMAVSDFEGSHAIAMHSDLAPGKMFLAQRGSGQAIFIGLAKDHYMATSEVYGFVEETPLFIKLNDIKSVDSSAAKSRGQIFILDSDTGEGIHGISAMTYDGARIPITENNLKTTRITSRDIDRQGFPHYFMKEISESPVSVEKTLQNRWKITADRDRLHIVNLDEKAFPQSIRNGILENRIKRIFFVGQGTAGVAASACADILNFYLNDTSLHIRALKASELSGFSLGEDDPPTCMSDSLVIAITQSGTTADTNRTIDMVRERGAYTMAIVNRRDSDITFKVDGVFYTSSGRDIEMSVASTKAFYSQIVAGALLNLQIVSLKKSRDNAFISREIKELLELSNHMRTVLSMKNQIEASAKKLAVTRTYWATVGSGPNKIAADEIRIKLSELCYKTISSDYVEDKKHIDLSSEPLILVCASGTKETVMGDILKDTAIFNAHKATPIVIADEGDHRFDIYAADVFHIPPVSQHLAPILNTLIGHIWGYYAALAINDGSRFFYNFRENIQDLIEDQTGKGLDIYEIVLDKSFREKIMLFYNEFRKRKIQKQIPTAIGFDISTDLPLLLKYITGRLPVTDFELDFGYKGTASNMVNTLFSQLGESINQMARPVDAIKHQAKTVTVGTSRIREKIEGILFEALLLKNFNISNLTNKNIMVLKNLQGIVHQIKGATLYQIDGLTLLGEPTEETTISILSKEGTSATISSRIEQDNKLKGTKRIIVGEGNVYIGKGRKDGRSILIIPLISPSNTTLNTIRYLYLMEIVFKPDVSRSDKIKALGGKYERIKNIVQENSLAWEDTFLDQVPMEELFGSSAEKIGEKIIGFSGT